MITIIVTQEDSESNEFEFEGSRTTISIGRRSSNDVCIPDLSVSGNHAFISLEHGSYWMEDLNSTNGTYINGAVIKRQTLQSDDEILIGKVHLVFKSSGIATEPHSNAISANDSVPHSDFGDGRIESAHEIDPLSLNEASDGIGDSTRVTNRAELVSLNANRSISDIDSARAKSDELLTANDPHPLEGLQHPSAVSDASPISVPTQIHELDTTPATSKGAVIEIKNGAKSGQILPIDKPVTTLGRPGIQIAAIMRKPDGYFLMHIESDDSVERPTLNSDTIGDEPVLLHSGDELNVAGIDVEFMLS